MGTPAGAAVPLCDLQAQYRELQPHLEEVLTRVLAGGQVILGPEVAALEEEIARYCGTGYAIGCASGTDALLLALQTLGIGPGDEVILPSFSFFATAGMVCRSGARPVFADIDAESYNLDPLQVENKITSRTRAILVVHLFGQCADMEPLWKVAERHQLPIIEDAAQAFGADYQGKRTGTLGAFGCFSFYPSKILGAYGDAGMVVTNDPEWSARLAALRVHGMEVKYYHKHLGWNARLDALQAALLRVKLPRVEGWIEARQAAAHRYDALIDEYYLGRFLCRPAVRTQRRHVFNQYVVRVQDNQRDPLVRYLHSEKIGCEIYYPVPLHLQECLAYLGYQKGDFPASEDACRDVLALPMYPELQPAQQRRVIQACAAFLRQQARKAA
ncbi:MAG TPA: DegT/DnrJ/EryC1/StrS family aminotransferase [Gemmataceae bacterium]|nr:DegT/DnrJ/EryC1/StrS family aminotransferase [Gemmataceae bacterium]